MIELILAQATKKASNRNSRRHARPPASSSSANKSSLGQQVSAALRATVGGGGGDPATGKEFQRKDEEGDNGMELTEGRGGDFPDEMTIGSDWRLNAGVGGGGGLMETPIRGHSTAF